MLFPDAMPPDMSWPIMFCMFGSDSMEVAMFISAGLPSSAFRSIPPGPPIIPAGKAGRAAAGAADFSLARSKFVL